MTTKLLRLGSPGIGNQQRAVVYNKLPLQLQCAVRINVLGIIGNNGLSYGLTDSVDLRSMSTTLDTDTDVNCLESVLSSNQNRLVDLEAQDLGLQKVDGRAVNVNEATALLCVGDRSSGLQGNL